MLRLALGILLLLNGCGGSSVSNAIVGAEFSPNPASVSAGMCSSQIEITSTANQSITFVSLTAQFMGSSGSEAMFSRTAAELSAAFSTIELPSSGFLQESITFDLGSSGLTLPATGTIVLIGTGASGTTQFVGTLQCQ